MPLVPFQRPLKVSLVFPLRPGPWPEIVRGVYRYAAERTPPWHLSLYTDETPAVALSGKPDGVVAMVRTPAAAAEFAAWGGPVVDTGADLKEHSFARVLLDSPRIGRLAADHLLCLKNRHFAFLGDRSKLAGERVRQGFVERLAEAGWTCEDAPAGAFDDPYSEGSGARAAAAAWLAQLARPVAVFACHDALAHRLVEVCSAEGLRVPQDVAVLGLLNDDFLCLTSRPQISSVAVPLAEVGYEAARTLDGVMTCGESPGRVVLPSPGVVVARQSTDAEAVADPELVVALRYIRDHAREAIGVDEIAGASGLSRSVLERRFRAALDRGPLAELIRVRLETAKRLLQQSALSVKEIAYEAGFHDARHLSVTFRAKVGVSPVEYRSCFRPV